MFKLAVAALASAWLVEAQEPDNNAYHPHAAFAFIRTGERTPILRKGQPTLTALGASQMFELGKNFRTRYIAGTSPNGLGVEHISGLSKDILNINQIQIRTLDSPYLVASAQAFMQGLYPPVSIANNNGSMGAATGLLADGRAIDFPLSGYQYPNIETTSLDTPSSVFVAGSEACPISRRDSMMYFTTGKFRDTLTANRGFYNNSLKVEYFEGNLKPDDMDYTYALEIADYMQYQYMHNLTINRALDNATMARIQSLADEEAWYLWGNTSASSSDADNQAIAGKTLASSILGAFQKLIIDQLSPGDKTDMSYPLTFFFGEQQPFISLISLMMADYKDTSFRSIPPWGSSMIFELFSTGNSTAFPSSTEDLWVRFYFHNGTAFDAKQLLAFPIFGNGRSRTDMPWSEFSLMFNHVALDTFTEWCATCKSAALFCTGVGDDQTSPLLGGKNNQKHYTVSPAVGGVIGAIVTLVVAGILFGLAMLLGGVRLHRVHKSKKSELGGFKGSAKLASDQDLSIAKNGAPPAGLSFVPDRKVGHERVGSWELRQKEMGVGEERRESLDGIDAVTAKPVQPHERV